MIVVKECRLGPRASLRGQVERLVAHGLHPGIIAGPAVAHFEHRARGTHAER